MREFKSGLLIMAGAYVCSFAAYGLGSMIGKLMVGA